jgi:hypothetical protein
MSKSRDALIHHHEVALRLARDVVERLPRQGGGIAEGKQLIDLQWPIDPMPAISLLGKRKVRRVVLGERLHDQFQAVPLRTHHMRKGLISQRFRGQHDGPLAALGDIVLVDIEGKLDDRAGRSRQVRLDVHRVHIAVFCERQRKSPNRLRAVAIAEVVAKRFVRFEYCAHVVPPSGRTFNGVDATPSVRRREARRIRTCWSTFILRS